MSDISPNFRSSGSSSDPNLFSKVGSTICLILGPATFGLTMGFEYAGRNLLHGSPYTRYAALAVAGLSMLMLFIGSMMGILALLMMKPGGRTSIVFRSMAGIVISSLFAAIFVPNFMQARARTLAQHDAVQNLRAAVKDLSQQQVQALKTNGQTVDFKKLNDALDQGARTTTGDDALVFKAGKTYMVRLQALQGAYDAAAANLKAAHVLSTSNLVSRETVQQRKAIVQTFLKCNADLMNFYSAGEDTFRGELERLNVSPSRIAVEMAGFHKSNALHTPVVLAIRGEDDKIGRGMLAILDLLDTNWGHWNYDQENRHLRFENTDVLTEYNGDLREISNAARDQTVSQKQLAAVVSQATSR